MILVIFALTYLGIAMGHVPGLKLNRVGIALLGAIAMMVFGGVSTATAVSYVNWPTIALLFGFFVIAAQLRLSGFYDRVAGGIASRLRNPARFLLLLMVVTAGLSAFLNHDIVCFVFTPVVGAALVRRGLNPVGFLVALAIASNIGAAGTLIGNPQDMMIAAVAHLAFGPYILWTVVPVVVALGLAYGLIWILSRGHLQPARFAGQPVRRGTYAFDRAHTIKGLVVLILVVALLFTPVPKEFVALAAAAVHLASPKFRTEDLLGQVDWPILVLFIALFVVTGGFDATGVGEAAARWLAHSGLDLGRPAGLAVTTALLSNLVNNSAAVMLLVKVVDVSHPVTAYVLALANSFGGSLIIVGSVSNMIVVQQARDLGVRISFRDFARLGIPVTLAALSALIGWALLVT